MTVKPVNNGKHSLALKDKNKDDVLLTLSMLHATIVAISHLVEKVPTLELLHATEFIMRLV